jgi:hypothetical protein
MGSLKANSTRWLRKRYTLLLLLVSSVANILSFISLHLDRRRNRHHCHSDVGPAHPRPRHRPLHLRSEHFRAPQSRICMVICHRFFHRLVIWYVPLALHSAFLIPVSHFPFHFRFLFLFLIFMIGKDAINLPKAFFIFKEFALIPPLFSQMVCLISRF